MTKKMYGLLLVPPRHSAEIDDIKKAQSYSYEELSGYDTAHRRILLAEHRPASMEWFYMTPRSALQRS